MAVPGVRPRGSSSVGLVTGSLKMGTGALASGHLDESKRGSRRATRREYLIQIHARSKESVVDVEVLC